MDNRTKGILTLIGVGIVCYAAGYHNGVKSMVTGWQQDVMPTLATYLAAQDAIAHIIKPDDDSPE